VDVEVSVAVADGVAVARGGELPSPAQPAPTKAIPKMIQTSQRVPITTSRSAGILQQMPGGAVKLLADRW